MLFFFQFGFHGMFVGRIDYQDKEKRQRTKTMEMVWTTSDSLGNQMIYSGSKGAVPDRTHKNVQVYLGELCL